MLLSILIKTYNEEVKIVKCIQSVVNAAVNLNCEFEIIVADSISSDSTVALASNYPVTIVQLCNVSDRGCGSGVQLGYQYAKGKYVYFLDGDMELQEGFLARAIYFLEVNPLVAGVSGILEDSQVTNRFDHHRIKNKSSSTPGELKCLAGGGLYRREAIEDAGGYAGNRNLKAFEEAELGMRLRQRGWQLFRLPYLAVVHAGHSESTFSLLRRHWNSGRLDSAGVLLKASVGEPWFFQVLHMTIHPLATIGYWATLTFSAVFFKNLYFFYTIACLGLLTTFTIVVKKRNLTDAAFSVLHWHISAIGIVRGFLLHKYISPNTLIPSCPIDHNFDPSKTMK